MYAHAEYLAAYWQFVPFTNYHRPQNEPALRATIDSSEGQ